MNFARLVRAAVLFSVFLCAGTSVAAQQAPAESNDPPAAAATEGEPLAEDAAPIAPPVSPVIR